LAEVLPYVKAEEPAEDGRDHRRASEGAELALKPFVGRLHIAYAVDEGTSFELVAAAAAARQRVRRR